MPSSKLKEKIREMVRQKLRERDKSGRKKVEGQVNIAGVTHPRSKKPSKVKPTKNTSKPPQPASVSIGAHGGKYIQEASGHKRYLHEGSLAGRAKIKKSIEDLVKEIAVESEKRDFIKKKFKTRRR